MAARQPKPFPKKRALQELRFYTDVIGRVMHRPMSPAHQEALVRYAASKLPRGVLGRLHTQSGQAAALAFIARTLEQPRAAR